MITNTSSEEVAFVTWLEASLICQGTLDYGVIKQKRKSQNSKEVLSDWVGIESALCFTSGRAAD